MKKVSVRRAPLVRNRYGSTARRWGMGLVFGWRCECSLGTSTMDAFGMGFLCSMLTLAAAGVFNLGAVNENISFIRRLVPKKQWVFIYPESYKHLVVLDNWGYSAVTSNVAL